MEEVDETSESPVRLRNGSISTAQVHSTIESRSSKCKCKCKRNIDFASTSKKENTNMFFPNSNAEVTKLHLCNPDCIQAGVLMMALRNQSVYQVVMNINIKFIIKKGHFLCNFKCSIRRS